MKLGMKKFDQCNAGEIETRVKAWVSYCHPKRFKEYNVLECFIEEFPEAPRAHAETMSRAFFVKWIEVDHV